MYDLNIFTQVRKYLAEAFLVSQVGVKELNLSNCEQGALDFLVESNTNEKGKQAFFENITALNLSQVKLTTDCPILDIAYLLPNLTSLVLTNCTGSWDSVIKPLLDELPKLKKLEKLCVQYLMVDNECM